MKETKKEEGTGIKTPPTFKDKAYGLLLKNDSIVISEKIRPENREPFIELIKDTIRHDTFRPHGFYLEISSDYTKVRKKQYMK